MLRSLSEETFHFDDPRRRLDDPHRLRSVNDTGLMDVRGDRALDHLTSLAAQITGGGVAAVCLVGSTRQTFPSAYGLSGPLDVDREIPLSHSFSQHVVTNDAALVVPDAREHPVLRLNPSVEGHGVVAYAGYPLRNPDGMVLGALCLTESTPRTWSAEQLDRLGDLAVRIETEIALRLQTRRAQMCEQRMQHVIDGVGDTAVVAADASGVVTVMNPGAERLFGLRADTVIGTESLSRVLRSSEPLGPKPVDGQPQDWLIAAGTGRTKVVSIRSSVLRDPSGNLDGYILVADDVSSRRETETLLREAVRTQSEAIERLTELDRVRTVFVATASHELRTPVSSILGYTELLVEGAAGALSPEQLKLLSRVDANGKRLFALVEELLDLSLLDSRTPTMVRTSMDANTAAENAWEALQPRMADRGLQARLELCASAPQIIGDPAHVERALHNLLQNAVKFTPDGGSVRLTVRESSEGVEYEVADTGIGIAAAEQASVFDPFFRSQDAHSLSTPGAGIGLAIVRRISEAHEGEVHLTSRPGSGTTVVLALPAMMREERHTGRIPGVALTEELPLVAPRTGLEAELRAALEGNLAQFVLHYQPIVDLSTGKVVAVEALAHWQHPVRGLLGPEQLVALAEATGLIHRLGDWVLDRAVRDAVSLTHQGRELDLAVNVSVRQLDEETVAKVRRVLDSRGLRPARLILEVNESAFVDDEVTTAATYRSLSELGVKLAIDDFGTGSSSLLHLRRNPVNALKIDREFVAGIAESADDEAICQSIISLAGAVGASTVGGGVETTAQLAVLRSLGCVRGQGSLWSSAVPLDGLAVAFAACDEVPVAAPRARTTRTPEGLPAEVRVVIAEMHAEGASRHTIAAALNRTFGSHPNGVRWTAGAVARELPPEGAARVDLAAPSPSRGA